MIKFEIGGRQIDPDKIGDKIMAEVLKAIRAKIQEKVGTIRDPDTGAFPTVVIRGNSLDDLKMSIEGPPEVIALAKQRLGIAKALQAGGIDTWWDRWCISTGDSLRQKIDEGLAGCTHFLVLLTQHSIKKPWVNQEMDAGLVRKLRNVCRFLPVRYNLPASELPPLLSGMHAPEVAADEDITQLIHDIYGVTRKPPLGTAPQAIAQSAETKTGYSTAAEAITRLFVERTKHAVFADPQFSVEMLAEETCLTVPDTKDGLFELSHFFKDISRHVLVEACLFTEFDKFWKPWNPAEDAVKLAAEIANDPDFPVDCQQIADLYGWEPRRLNPAITYLFERGLLVDYKALGVPQFVMVRVVGKSDEIRRFLKGRQ